MRMRYLIIISVFWLLSLYAVSDIIGGEEAANDTAIATKKKGDPREIGQALESVVATAPNNSQNDIPKLISQPGTAAIMVLKKAENDVSQPNRGQVANDVLTSPPAGHSDAHITNVLAGLGAIPVVAPVNDNSLAMFQQIGITQRPVPGGLDPPPPSGGLLKGLGATNAPSGLPTGLMASLEKLGTPGATGLLGGPVGPGPQLTMNSALPVSSQIGEASPVSVIPPSPQGLGGPSPGAGVSLSGQNPPLLGGVSTPLEVGNPLLAPGGSPSKSPSQPAASGSCLRFYSMPQLIAMERVCGLCHSQYSSWYSAARDECRQDCFHSNFFRVCFELFTRFSQSSGTLPPGIPSPPTLPLGPPVPKVG